MRPDHLARLLDTHGADPARWPPAEAAAARALLAASPEARAMQARAALVDAALNDSLPPADPAALARMRHAVAAAVARAPLPVPATRPGLAWAGGLGEAGIVQGGGGLLGWLRPVLPAGCGALLTLAACALWLSWAPLQAQTQAQEESWGAPRILAMMEPSE
ncbi:hypothetical protein LPC08_17735 [Roseomonas sp. OT10]|uniref:hypothetical protein n=1 Tax=Roseomonas cutis TaxID=2897332 RepID=UPI001E479463|nr:hypothetical protein [Roseomonas sp. OT10]UFN47840.1 hypothetical protein LPC08_17735 [Roseomonas sp. OT10]